MLKFTHYLSFIGFCITLIIGSCSIFQEDAEVCNPKGEIFSAIRLNQEIWNESLGVDTPGIDIEINKKRIGVNRFGNGFIVLTSKYGGPNATITSPGTSGYYYSPSGEPIMTDLAPPDIHEYMGDNIYCYKID